MPSAPVCTMAQPLAMAPQLASGLSQERLHPTRALGPGALVHITETEAARRPRPAWERQQSLATDNHESNKPTRHADNISLFGCKQKQKQEKNGVTKKMF